METLNRKNISMKGTPVAVVQAGELVTIWVSSPTGDSSDSHLFTFPCLTEAQAETVAQTWRNAWGL
jgi:hypothetical protein